MTVLSRFLQTCLYAVLHNCVLSFFRALLLIASTFIPTFTPASADPFKSIMLLFTCTFAYTIACSYTWSCTCTASPAFTLTCMFSVPPTCTSPFASAFTCKLRGRLYVLWIHFGCPVHCLWAHIGCAVHCRWFRLGLQAHSICKHMSFSVRCLVIHSGSPMHCLLTHTGCPRHWLLDSHWICNSLPLHANSNSSALPLGLTLHSHLRWD